MIYTDYAFYTGTYMGAAIPQDAFPALAREASSFIDLITYNRLNSGWNVTDAVKMATCAVADSISEYNLIKRSAVKHAGLKSESVGNWSGTYQDLSNIKPEIEEAKYSAAYPYLIFTGLMDRAAGR